MSSASRKIGFAGLGAMGFGMASNLLKARFHVYGFDVNPKALADFGELPGATSAATVRDASTNQEKFFVMVATPEQVDSLVFGEDGLADTLPRAAILCVLSTLPPDYLGSLGGRLRQRGRSDIRLVDCPVSGGVVGANAGSLTIMMGGDMDTLRQIEPELKAISAPGRTFHCGPLGSASTIKMLNQHLAGIHIVTAAEALNFAKVLGLSSREAYRILMDSEAASWIMGDRGISMLDADWSPKSCVTIFTKDMGIVNDAAESLSFPCPIASVAHQAFVERAACGHGRDDDSSVVCNYEGITGKVVAEVQDCKAVHLSAKPTAEASAITFCAQDGTPYLKNLKSVVPCNTGNLSSRLDSLPDGSIVGLIGLDDQYDHLALSSKYPGIRFVDCQVVNSHDFESVQVLFSAQDADIVSTMQVVFPPEIKLVPVDGPFGAALAMFLVIRLASLIHIAAAAECLSLAAASGVSTQLVYDLIAGAAGSSAQFRHGVPKMQKADFGVSGLQMGGSFSNAMKELRSLRTTQLRLGFPGRLTEAAYQIFKGVNRGLGDGNNISTAAIVKFWGPADLNKERSSAEAKL